MASTTTLPRERTQTIRTYSATGQWGRRLQRAADIQARAQLLEAELRELRTEFLAHMTAQSLDCIEVGDFRASRRTRHKWLYTPETEREMLKLTQLQRWEQRQGHAIDTPTPYVSLITVVS
jgi:hypothetical protein